jgi:hypothetical protein
MSSIESDDFWSSLDGLMARAELVAQSFVWGLWNGITQVFAGEQDLGCVEWVTAGDDQVCEVCADNEGTYEATDPNLPDIPVHPNCRCELLIP